MVDVFQVTCVPKLLQAVPTGIFCFIVFGLQIFLPFSCVVVYSGLDGE